MTDTSALQAIVERPGVAALFAALGPGEARLVGGAVRDGLLGVEVADLGPRALGTIAEERISSTCTVFAESEIISLIGRGADVDALNDRGQSPLAGAVFKAEPEVVAALLEHGADPDAGTPSARATAQMFGQEGLLER